jgi:hypothetical protein
VSARQDSLFRPPAGRPQGFQFDGNPLPTLPSSRTTLCAKLAALFRAHPGKWLDGRELATVAGAYGWRSRVSDLRRAPYNLTIENRVRTLPGSKAKCSEYRLVVQAAGVDLGGAA